MKALDSRGIEIEYVRDDRGFKVRTMRGNVLQSLKQWSQPTCFSTCIATFSTHTII